MTAPHIPPHDLAAEQGALASVIIDSDTWATVGLLDPEAFYRETHRTVWRVMQAMHAEGQPLEDLEMIHSRANAMSGMEVDLSFFIGLMREHVTALYAGQYVARLRDLHAQRTYIRDANRLTRLILDGLSTQDELAEAASKLPLLFERRTRSSVTGHSAALDQALTEMMAPESSAIPTEFPDLNAQLLGFEPGALYILAARPAMGKSALGYGFALHAAGLGHPVAFASLEMPARQLVMRALATAAGVDGQRIRQRRMTAMDQQRIKQAAERQRHLPISYLEATDQTGASLAADARKLRAAGKLDLLVIDYLQLVESGKASENRQQEVAQLSRSLKKLALELEVPIIVLSQLSRAVEMRGGNKRPQLSDLRDSGSIEQDADVVMFIYREEYYEPNTDQQGVAEIIIGKQRSGPVGTVKLSYSAEFVRFGSLSGMRVGA